MLRTVGFTHAPHNVRDLVLGVLVSRNDNAHDVSFSVPAHVLLTLNLVLNGTLSVSGQELPNAFATGPHTRARRYCISGGASLLTLFCRSELLTLLGSQRAHEIVNRWFKASDIFTSWQWPEQTSTPSKLHYESFIFQLLQCASVTDIARPASSQGAAFANALLTMYHRPEMSLARVAAEIDLSERSLQRLFRQRWGMSPKLVHRMLRLQRCVDLWGDEPINSLKLSDLAAQLLLSDQAHLAREFRELVGHPPSSLKSTHSQANNGDLLWALKTGNTLLTPLVMSVFFKTNEKAAPNI